MPSLQTEIHIYPSAGYAFFDDTRTQMYNSKTAKDAWQKSPA